MLLVAANGDEQVVHVAGTQVLDLVNFAFSDFTGTYDISGGTGRFSGATGTGDMGAHLTIDSGYLTGNIQNGYLSGTIVLPLP